MTGRWSLGILLWIASGLALSACGGHSRRGYGDDGGQGYGGTGAGGSASGGVGGVSSAGATRGGATSRQDCVVDGKTYADGSAFFSGCNACSCQDGIATCDARACEDGCTEAGKHYAVGESFPASDGCNTCTCLSNGTVACTMRQCPSCEGARDAYAAALLAARKCEPRSAAQCQATLPAHARCSCEVFVNGSNRAAIQAATEAAALYDSGDCEVGVCPPCAEPPSFGYCSAAGLCEVFDPSEPAPCKVAGVVYPSGTSGIPDLTSCNQCRCDDGQLSCTAVGCPLDECPAGRLEATQCALCSATGECLFVDYDCLPTCDPGTSACERGACVDGVCRHVCGAE